MRDYEWRKEMVKEQETVLMDDKRRNVQFTSTVQGNQV